MAAAQRQGQRHDRIPPLNDGDESSAPKSARAMDNDISITQKMLSAVSGSILTSLLGKL